MLRKRTLETDCDDEPLIFAYSSYAKKLCSSATLNFPINISDKSESVDTTGKVFIFTQYLDRPTKFLQEIYLKIKFPAQQSDSVGDFFSYVDFYPIKIINSIKFYLSTRTREKEIYSIGPNTLQQYLFSKYENYDNLKQLFGGEEPSLTFAKTADATLCPERVFTIPIPILVSSLNLENMTNALKIKLVVKTAKVETCCIRSEFYKPSSDLSVECLLNFVNAKVQHTTIDEEENNENLTAVPYEKNSRRRMEKNTDELKLENRNINNFSIFAFNPKIASEFGGELFYGHTVTKAILNYLNTFVYPVCASGQNMLRLNVLAWTAPSEATGIVVERLDDLSFRASTNKSNIVFRSNMPLSNLDSDIFLDLKNMLFDYSNVLDMANLSYVDLQIITETDVLTIYKNLEYKEIVNGLFVTKTKHQAVVGFSNYIIRPNADHSLIKLCISQPSKPTANLYARKNFCILRDPLYCFADLDKSIKYSIYDVKISANGSQFSSLGEHILDIVNFKNAVNSGSNLQSLKCGPIFKYTILGTANVVIPQNAGLSLQFSIGLKTELGAAKISSDIQNYYIKELMSGPNSEILLSTLVAGIEIYAIEDQQIINYDLSSDEYKNRTILFLGYD